MDEWDQKQVVSNMLPLIAIALMASGVLVNTLPLESKRPSDPDRARFSHAGKQDVDARLWEDPFAAMRHLETTRSPEERCAEAIKDTKHHPVALAGSIDRVGARRAVTVLPVLVPGGPYFEDGESRRRARYAVVMALLNDGWEPRDEEKLGYVWTLESCRDSAVARRIPELLPYEWFNKQGGAADANGGRALLVLWVDEDSVTNRPLRGMTSLLDRVATGGAACMRPPLLKPDDPLDKAKVAVAQCLEQSAPSEAPPPHPATCLGGATVDRSHPWCDTRVVGPWSSDTLTGLVRDLARIHATDDPKWLHFYSSGATADMTDDVFDDAIARQAQREKKEPHRTEPLARTALRARFAERVTRLTPTNQDFTDSLVHELELRLTDATPFERIGIASGDGGLCDATIVIVAEGDTSYARSFGKLFEDQKCDRRNAVVPVSYLRGLDGVLPTGAGAPSPGAATQGNGRSGAKANTLLDQAALERADGRSQYDYLRRLAGQLVELDQREKDAGRAGVRAIGVLGNDVYDKLLVLDGLRGEFPRAVFFTADLDARLIGGEVADSTRNVVVSSGFGLTLRPELQGAASPFRDTYQTGTYLATRVAIDPGARDLPSDHFKPWFSKPRLFELGRTRAVPLTRAPAGKCDAADLAACASVHPTDESQGFEPVPRGPVALAIALIALSTVPLTLLLSRRARDIARAAWLNASPLGVAALMLGLAALAAGLLVIYLDSRSPDGEPFAWLEGVSLWPTQIFKMLILALTIALLVIGRWRLLAEIDAVANEFRLRTLSAHDGPRQRAPEAGLWGRIKWLWFLDDDDDDSVARESPTEQSPWLDYLDRMRFGPSATRVVLTTGLYFVFAIALMALDWPHSPHRGPVSAWFNHLLQIAILAGMMALLFAALDASAMATRLLGRLAPSRYVPRWSGPHGQELIALYPVGDRLIRLWVGFNFAVRLASAVNHFIYLPFLVLLLIVPARSRVFDAWNFPVPYAALLAISVLLAVLSALSLRRAARHLKDEVLAQIDDEAQRCELQAKLSGAEPCAQQDIPPGPNTEAQQTFAGANRPEPGDELPSDPDTSGGPTPSPAVKAELLRRIAEQIRAQKDGPFRPLTQEPVVRAILIVLGGTGGISTVEWLTVGRG